MRTQRDIDLGQLLKDDVTGVVDGHLLVRLRNSLPVLSTDLWVKEMLTSLVPGSVLGCDEGDLCRFVCGFMSKVGPVVPYDFHRQAYVLDDRLGADAQPPSMCSRMYRSARWALGKCQLNPSHPELG